MQGWGRLSVVSILALPPPEEAGPVVAGKGSVVTFMTLPSLARQLTIARKDAIGFDPLFAPAARTNPLTLSSKRPLAFNSPEADVRVQGKPPPLMPRIGFWVPVNACGMPTIVSNSRIFDSLALTLDTELAKNVLKTISADKITG